MQDDVDVTPPPEARGREPIPVTRLTDHVVLIGHGRVGSVVSEALREHGIPYLVIESDQDAAAELRQQSIETITGNAADPEVVRAANLSAACCLLVAIPEAFEGGQAVMQARAANPDLLIVARAHSEEEVLHLKKHGASTVIMGEFEIARAMIEDVRKAVTVPRTSPEEALRRAPSRRRLPKRGRPLEASLTVMAHPLISTIVIALALAWVFGALAHRLRLPPLVGYLIAGVLIGPATPGFVADQTLASELAEIGVILLMFGVGLHFSLEQLLSVRAIAVPGAIAQIACATLLGMALGHWLGWSIGAGLVFGLALSVASTVVLLRALQERRLVETGRGRIAVGWLIVEDMVMVLTLVLLPAFAGVLGGEGAGDHGSCRRCHGRRADHRQDRGLRRHHADRRQRLIPWVLHYMAHTGSRELFRLAVFVIALGVAFAAAELFGVSFALGAFFAGMILSESPLSQRAAEETLPLRDAFAVIFFVSVGMLFKPAILIEDPLAVLATLAIILLGKSLAAFAIIRLFGYPASTALLVSVSLAQIGEFSFILAGLGVDLGLLPERGRNLILAGAILSILLNPLLFAGLDMLQAWRDKAKAEVKPVEPRGGRRRPRAGPPHRAHKPRRAGRPRQGRRRHQRRALPKRRCRSSSSRATMRGLPS